MSSVPPGIPPNMPPGGGPIPPYDPKAQWRAYREQQKAAWRAQREGWKAERANWKAHYRGYYMPRVPSVVGPVILVGVGVIALLIMTGHLAAEGFWAWYGQWWPLLLIGAGLALLVEWALDMKREVPVRRGGNFVGILIVLAIVGFTHNGWSHWGPDNWGDHGGDFFNTFGLPEHDSEQQVLSSAIPANASVDIENPRGDISITAGDGSTIEVEAHKVAYASSDDDAKKIFDAEAPHLTVSGNAVLLKSESNSNGKINLTITVPKTAQVTVNSGKGDLTAAGLGAGIHFTAHGDVHLSSIIGTVEAHFANGKHDFSAHEVEGDVTADGDCNDLTLSQIKGKVMQSGEILGDVHMENVGGPIHLHTSVTDLQLGELTGDLTLNSDDLRVSEAKGTVRVATHSKDIDLNQIYGDTFIENRDGRIAVEPAGSFAIDAKNSKGDVEITLPPGVSAAVKATTRNGDIVSDYPMPSVEGENKTASLTIGGGSARMTLSAENGDVRIKKGEGFKAVPAAPAVPLPPAPAKAAGPPHGKNPKALPAQPVTQ